MVTVLHRLLALPLIAALTAMNVQAADLHMHADTDIGDTHHHGPATHHHAAADPHWSDTAQLRAADENDTVVHVALTAAPAPTVKLVHADVDAPVFDDDTPAAPAIRPITARAHDPPSVAAHPLRAPPAASSL